MTLQSWIVQTGPKEVAKLLNVDPAAVSLWRNKKTLPRPHQMKRIKQLSRGRVSYEVMIEKFLAAKPKLN